MVAREVQQNVGVSPVGICPERVFTAAKEMILDPDKVELEDCLVITAQLDIIAKWFRANGVTWVK